LEKGARKNLSKLLSFKSLRVIFIGIEKDKVVSRILKALFKGKFRALNEIIERLRKIADEKASLGFKVHFLSRIHGKP
jgi:uncharacterized protein Yka (UPF0111/DUF47 family)